MEENKRTKICKSTQTMTSATVQDHKDPETPQWSQLPATIIIEIYKKLGDVDRVSMARVCQTWNQGFYVPELWRSRIVTFRGLRKKQDIEFHSLYKSKTALKISYGRQAIEFTKQFPTSLQEIELHFMLDCEPYETEIINDFIEFSACLDSTKLRNIFISYLGLDTARQQMEKELIDSLKRLLHNQHWLKKFRMQGFFNLETGLEILQCLAEASAATIEDLSLNGLLHNGMSLDRAGRVGTELQKFTDLSCIHLDYGVMSEELVKTWVTGCPNLSRIKLHADTYLRRSNVISCEAWMSLVRTHRNLLVEFHSLAHQDTRRMLDILSPSIPLFNLSWYTFVDTTELELIRFLNRVANYHRTIKHLYLYSLGQFPNLDTTTVQSMLSKCTHLLPFKCANYVDDFTENNKWILSQNPWWLAENDI